jgi:hypothetical protein
MYKLYCAPGTCALATHNALEEAGAPYEAVLVDFRKRRGAQSIVDHRATDRYDHAFPTLTDNAPGNSIASSGIRTNNAAVNARQIASPQTCSRVRCR